MNKIWQNWSKNRINLLRSPPSSGKTTLATALEKRLKTEGREVKYITLTHWNPTEFPDLLHNNATFDAFCKKEIQCTWSECAASPDPVFILIDGAQVLYQGGGPSFFWTSLNTILTTPEAYMYSF